VIQFNSRIQPYSRHQDERARELTRSWVEDCVWYKYAK
jgi:hypothetical protein